MHDSVVPMEVVGDNIHSTPLPRPVDPRAPLVEEREEAVDEGYEQRHQEALCREQRRSRVEERQKAPVVSPCDQCHGVSVECRASRYSRLGFGCCKRLGGFVTYLECEVNGAVALRPTLLPHLRESSRQSFPTSWRRRCWKSGGKRCGGGFRRSCRWRWACRARGSVVTGMTSPRSVFSIDSPFF
ncbi:hypothetical protein CNBN2000 [Cryptococcus gattii WM276]|uniref:Uncharacterized protein n=1 Tax=Cryptococcus gattii serotype B (strain WM276 / ATCC MYA-4071) TaxID=367775 RepID=E6RCT2_CRYGW|nr:uncharacterized protein CGB_J1450W [Cryptococcus gattii WM276]ADV24617.1 hypothetical protein CNBN2000 [Cryptococcus gattii WM276]